MRGTVRARPRLPRVTLNTDHRRHPVENSLALFTFAAGIASFALGLVVRNTPAAPAGAALAAVVTGIASLAIGFYAQMISATRAQRILIVTGMVAAFVGLALGLAHGGLV